MKNTFTLIVLLFLGYYANSQPREIVVIIDTINFLSNEELEQFKVAAVDSVLVDDSDKFIRYATSEYAKEVKISNNKYPNFTGSVKLNSDSSFIEISLDTSVGKMQVTGLKGLKEDTLRIQKFEQINRCYTDTIFTYNWYYRIYNDSLATNAHKFKKKIKINKAKCNNSSSSTKRIVINNQIHSAITNKSKDPHMIVISGNGYKPLKKYFRLKSKNANLDGRRLFKTHFKSIEINYYTIMRIDLLL